MRSAANNVSAKTVALILAPVRTTTIAIGSSRAVDLKALIHNHFLNYSPRKISPSEWRLCTGSTVAKGAPRERRF